MFFRVKIQDNLIVNWYETRESMVSSTYVSNKCIRFEIFQIYNVHFQVVRYTRVYDIYFCCHKVIGDFVLMGITVFGDWKLNLDNRLFCYMSTQFSLAREYAPFMHIVQVMLVVQPQKFLYDKRKYNNSSTFSCIMIWVLEVRDMYVLIFFCEWRYVLVLLFN